MYAKYFVFATLPKTFRDLNKTWYNERSHCEDVHITRVNAVPQFWKEL
jgi:hypothetical protein